MATFCTSRYQDGDKVLKCSYIVLARAKSEALDNIYSLLKQNIDSCKAMRRRQRER